jgi:hypothetical protein
MAMDYDSDRRRSTGFLSLLLALLLGGALLGMFLHSARSGIAGRLAGMIVGRPLNIVSAPVVVDRVQRLSRLETVVYSLDTVVEGEESSPVLPDALAGDKLLMIVNGNIVAGVDLSKLKPEDVQITESSAGRSIRLAMPPSQVFTTSLDEGKSRVYARDTGLFVRADPNLETQVRQKAQAQLQQAALTDGILDAASRNARATVTSMLQGLGFSSVDVR